MSLTLGHKSKTRSLLSSWLTTLFFRSFTWIVLGDAGLHFSFILVRKTHAVEEEIK